MYLWTLPPLLPQIQSHDQFAKLENADILELVLQQLKGTAKSAKTVNIEPLRESAHFNAGMEQCATETMQFLQKFSEATNCGSRALGTSTESPMIQFLDAAANSDGIVLDLRIKSTEQDDKNPPKETNDVKNTVALCDQEILQLPQIRQNSPPARREVLEKIRRKIFEKRDHQQQQQLQQQQLQQQRFADGGHQRDFLDDGYDSDETLFMWRPW